MADWIRILALVLGTCAVLFGVLLVSLCAISRRADDDMERMMAERMRRER